MGQARTDTLRLDSDHRLKLELHGTGVLGNPELLTYREPHEALRLASPIGSELHSIRTGENTRHGVAALLRYPICRRLAGDDDAKEAKRLALEPPCGMLQAVKPPNALPHQPV